MGTSSPTAITRCCCLKEVAFRADAALAKPEICEGLEERGVKYAIRIPSTESHLTRRLSGAMVGRMDGLPLPSE